MSETIQQKYDPDDFDPMVVKTRKSPWRLFLPICFALASLGILAFLRFRSSHFRAYQPGNWIGNAPFLEGLELFILGLILSVISVIITLQARRYVQSMLLILLFVGAFSLNLNSRFSPKASTRYNAELPQYKDAVRTNHKFGDQFSEEINGRTLIYWRWMTWDLDNAVGVIYDPADKLSIEGDQMAFRAPSTGVLFKIQKIEPKWYFVEHS